MDLLDGIKLEMNNGSLEVEVWIINFLTEVENYIIKVGVTNVFILVKENYSSVEKEKMVSVHIKVKNILKNKHWNI